jgi:hypothetical protein
LELLVVNRDDIMLYVVKTEQLKLDLGKASGCQQRAYGKRDLWAGTVTPRRRFVVVHAGSHSVLTE